MSAPELTPEQRAAIDSRDTDVFCEAGAGSGKTRVLVERYCESVTTDGAEVEGILAFTFTDRAAAELRGRIRRSLMNRSRAAKAAGDAGAASHLADLARATERAWVTTIHGFCRRLLASHPVAAGLDPRFRVLDASEASRLRERAVAVAIAELMEHASEDVVSAAAAYKPYRLAEMTLQAHERLRSQGMTAPELPAVTAPVHSPKHDEEERVLRADELRAATAARAALEDLLERFNRAYERAKAERSGLDFADLELRSVELLRSSTAIREIWAERFGHILVDEFQDTNRVQLELIDLLRGPDARLFCVGDENQSIYRFRNAELQVFRERRDEARGATGTELLELRGNFRSLPAPLALANVAGEALLDGFPRLDWGRPQPAAGDPAGAVELLLVHDRPRARKPPWRPFADELDPPPSESTLGSVAEARALARRLRAIVDAGEAKRGDIVVLLRAFTHVDAFAEALGRAGLDPYVLGGRGYWSQQQVEDVIRLLGCVSNPLDDEYLLGALASPAAGVSPDALWLLRRASGGSKRHLWPLVEWRYGDAEREPEGLEVEWLDEVPAEDAERLRRFCATLAPLRDEAPLIGIEALIERAMTAFGYDLALLARPGGPGRMANVRKLMRLAREFERHEGRDVAGFLAAAAESAKRDEREGMAPVRAEEHDGVRVMTVHAAKGLEFPVVAVPDLGRALNAGGRSADIVIGREPAGRDRRFGLRLAFPSAESFGLWEHVELNREESEAEAEEGARLVYVAATRAQDRLILSGCVNEELALDDPDGKPSNSPLQRLLPHLRDLGWAGTEGIVELPAPARAQGADPAEPDSATLPLTVSWVGPSAETARLLAEPLPAAAPPAPDEAGGPPPLMSERKREVPVGHLSYSALAEYERCGYRFYVERLLGVRLQPAPGTAPVEPQAGEEPERDGADDVPEPSADDAGQEARSRALALGRATHLALERSVRERWEAAEAEALAAILQREGLGADGDARELVTAGVAAWLGSELRESLAGWALRPEVPFVLPVGGTVIRGQIDLLAEGPGGELAVVDFKTDALRGRTPGELAARYEAQREVYALAVAGAATEPIRAVHLFLEDVANPVEETLGPSELEAARARLEALIARIRGGDFEPTPSPTSAICFGCPAAARLCPHPKWRPRAIGAAAQADADGDDQAETTPSMDRAAVATQGTLFR